MHGKKPDPRILVHHNAPILVIGDFPTTAMVGKETPEREGCLKCSLVVKHQPEMKPSKEQ